MERLEPKDVAALMKVREKRPKQADVRDAFRGKVRDLPARGKKQPYVVDIKDDRRAVQKWREMRRPYERAATRLSSEWSARQAKVKMLSPRGGVVEMAANAEGVAAKQGFLPAAIWSPVRKFAAAPRRWLPCGHYTETAGETVCYWCAEGR